MATRNKITEIIAGIKAIYPYYAKESDVGVLVKTWDALLKPYSDKLVDTAFYVCLQTCKTPPTPADVIQEVKEMLKAFEPTGEEMWEKFVAALREANELSCCFSFTAVDENGFTQGQIARKKAMELYEGLPSCLKTYCGSYGAFMLMARETPTSELKYERNRFLKALPDINKTVERRELLNPTNNKNLLN